jgi:thiol-disulfide isomerase/thioredoxin
MVPPRTLRGVKVTVLVALSMAILGAILAKAYDRFVAQPRLAEEAFDVQRANVPAPDVPLLGRDGKPFSLSRYRGAVVFVNFWATWCPPCREEMPSMLQLARELAREHPGKFRMVAVSADSGWPEVDGYFAYAFRGTPQELVVALDPEGSVARAYYCTARGVCPDIKFPETYIVDKAGRLVAYIVNSRDWTDPVARRFLERLIEG